MKNKLKKVMVSVLTFALLLGVVAVPSQQAQAKAKELTEADFKFTGKYASDFNPIIKHKNGRSYSLTNTVGEKALKKCIKTKRGITLTATKKQVFEKYGKVTVKKLAKSSTLFKDVKEDWKASKATYNMIKNQKYAVYSYEKHGSGSARRKATILNTYKLYFFFDKKDKVDTIIVSQDY